MGAFAARLSRALGKDATAMHVRGTRPDLFRREETNRINLVGGECRAESYVLSDDRY
jgi:hypothetical protein